MARLIDADAAKIRFANYREDCINEDDINAANIFADVVSELDEFPTIDPVHAAGAFYCNECKFACIGENESESWCFCKMTNRNINLTDFCSWGQRWED